jgi:two-component system CheB/CheR fusion protein
MAELRTTALDQLLEFVKDARGFDFTGYKRSSIERRVAKRLAEVELSDYGQYIEFLELHPEEFAELFNTLLINVTSFFRDRLTWEYVAAEVVPQLAATRPSEAPLRVWSAGASSGEEAYTIAMVFARVLGDDAFKERVKIYATDIDEEALDQARHAAYLPRQVEDIPRDALDRFFERTDQRYVFRNDLRRCVIFGRNDLVQDAPISRIDLLVCRNTLMYFTAETQSQILKKFHFALAEDGVLLLGRSEMLIGHSELFTPVDVRWRVSRKVPRPAQGDRVGLSGADPATGAGQGPAESLREAAFDIAGSPHVVLDAAGTMVIANDAARRTFGLGVNDFGRPIQDLELSYRPVELRGHMAVVSKELRGVDLQAIGWRLGDQERIVDVHLAPLLGDGALLGISIVYSDVTEAQRLEDQLKESRGELEQAYEELQSTVEELETTNEELQSTNEELETTNQELQSTNEELETMNEELQSTNEELEMINHELRHRTLELNDMNVLLETILTTTGLAVAVIDARQLVQLWNGHARELWGPTVDEAEDQHFMSLDIGLPVEQLKTPLRATLSGDSKREEVVVDATSRRGEQFQCRVTVMPLNSGADGQVTGAIVIMEPVDGRP